MEYPDHSDRSYLRAVVKMAQSGDTLILRGKPQGGPPPERTLCLANIIVPKLARNTGPNTGTVDEPCAWEARELLRKTLVGKEVRFKVEYTIPSGREFGSVFTIDGLAGESVAAMLIDAGLAKAKPMQADREATGNRAELERRQAAAEQRKVGMWADDASSHVRNITWGVEKESARRLVDQHKGKPVDAIVEFVRDPSTVRVELLPSHTIVLVSLTGIKGPSMKRADKGETPEPFAAEGKYFVESRLLQRDVQVLLEAEQNNGVLGTLVHPAGNITEALLQQGFAKCVDWSMAKVSSSATRDAMRHAEKAAKNARMRMWKTYVAPVPAAITAVPSQLAGQFVAKVLEIASPEAIVVRLASGPEEIHKIFLASVRQPRAEKKESSEEAGPSSNKEAGGGGHRLPPLFQVPHMFEAREFLRTKLLGKKVTVSVDYMKPAQDNFPAKTCATVHIGEINIGEALVSKGLATVVRHHADDENRASNYDDLLVAENRAQKAKKGVFSANAPVHHVNDLSQGLLEKSRQFLPFLTKVKRVQGVVEFVSSASRFKIYLPKETALITFVLSGINAPRAPDQKGQGGEPFGSESVVFAKRQCMQCSVELEVETVDKRGGFVGQLFVDGRNLAVALVTSGFAKVHASAHYGHYERQLTSAEAAAQESHLNIWHDYVAPDPEAEAAALAASQAAEQAPERTVSLEQRTPVLVTHVDAPTSCFVQLCSDESALATLMTALAEHLAASPPLPGAYKPKKNELCAAKYAEDGAWYRAKITALSGDRATVTYSDYGNAATVLIATELAPLPSDLAKTNAPFAHEVSLAYVTPPPGDDYTSDATTFFRELVLNRVALMHKENQRDGTVSLVDAETQTDVATDMVSAGLAVVDEKNRRAARAVAQLKAAQESAKNNRYGIWEYGDVTGDDAKEFGWKK